jgi:membrane protein implicated in regulation of membrane protease activity
MFSENRDYKNKIRALKKENRRLRAENYALREQLRISDKRNAERSRAIKNELKSRKDKARLYSKKSFAAFLLGSLRAKTLFSYYQRIVYVVRKYTFVTTSIKIFTFLFAFIQSSALIVLFTGTLAITVPITLIFSYVAVIFTFLFRKRITKKTKEALKGKKITVFFPSKGRAFEENSYLRALIKDITKNENSVVVVVSPYYFSPKGFSSSKKYYLATRSEGERVIMIRNHYYFTFKKKILSERPDTTLIF